MNHPQLSSSISPPNLPYRYICVEGNIGAGKTTLCRKLAKLYNCELVLEQFTDNPFLPLFYVDPERYAFPVEVFFMTERYKQLQNIVQNPNLFVEYIFGDYFFQKTLLFSRNSLRPEEFKLFLQLFSVLEKPSPKPDLLVYLHRSVPKLLDLIQGRDREIEKNIKPEYLMDIQNAYFEYFRSEVTFPILIIDTDQLDFKKRDEDLQEILQLMSQKYRPGIHQVTLS